MAIEVKKFQVRDFEVESESVSGTFALDWNARNTFEPEAFLDDVYLDLHIAGGSEVDGDTFTRQMFLDALGRASSPLSDAEDAYWSDLAEKGRQSGMMSVEESAELDRKHRDADA